MRTLVVVAAAAACGAPRPAPSGVPAGAEVVLVQAMTAESDLAFEVAIDGFVQPRQRWVRVSWLRDEAVLAAAPDGRVTRVLVGYRRDRLATAMSGADRVEAPGALDGRRFLVEAVGGALRVTDPDGGEVSAAIAARVRADHRWVGQPDPIRALIARGLAPGAELALPEAVLAATVGDEAPERFAGRARVDRVDRGPDGARRAVLAIELAATTTDDGWFRIRNHLTGWLTIDLDRGRATALVAAGALHRFDALHRRGRRVIGTGDGRARLAWSQSITETQQPARQ